MKVLSVHNYYRYRGGEEQVFESEAENLASHGHQVIRYTVHNDALKGMGALRAGRVLIWNQGTFDDVRGLIRRERPDVCHCHNTFPLISPSAYAAARAEGVPVVQTLHNYRLVCPGATLYRNGQVCQECLGKALPWPSIRYGCYRGSRLQTAAAALMLAVHRGRHTWLEQVDLYLAPSEFTRSVLVQAGLPAQKVIVKPSQVHPDPGVGPAGGDYVVYVGRLSLEKGLRTLLRAWVSLPEVPLKLVGEGPLRQEIEAFVSQHNLAHVQLLGQLSHVGALDAMKGASCLVFPSESFETFGLTAVEAMACGKPVIASRLGTMQETVTDGLTGLHFRPGDAEDLARKVAWAVSRPEELARMGRMARLEYEAKYSAGRNHDMLVSAYQRAIAGGRS